MNSRVLSAKNQKETGQSLYEVVVAIGISALVLVGAVSLSITSVRNSSFARNNSVATKFAQEGIEYVREQRDTSWSSFYAVAGGTKNLGNLSWPPGGSCKISSQPTFCRRVSLTSVSSDEVRTSVTVSWSDSLGSHSVNSVTTLTKWH